MKRMQWTIGLLALAVVLFVIWQNLQPASFGFLAWRISAPLAVWMVAALAVGWCLGFWSFRRRRET